MSESEHALLIVGLVFAIWLGSSFVYRASRGKPIFYRRLSGVRFREQSASGYSHRAWYTKLGGARNCVVVQITDQELDIHTHVPFNWFFLPEIYDLEFRVPIERILSTKQLRKFFAECVEIEFTTLDGNRHKVSLWLRRPDKFLETLRQSPIVPAPVQPT